MSTLDDLKRLVAQMEGQQTAQPADVAAGAAPTPVEVVPPNDVPPDATPAGTTQPSDTVTLSRAELADLIRQVVGNRSPDVTAVATEPGSPGETMDKFHADSGAIASFPATTTSGVAGKAYLYKDGTVRLG